MLARYILPAEIRVRVHLPEWGAGAMVSRARAVYDGLCRRPDHDRIRYAFERDILVDGAQVVRTPAEVLDLPGNGTCLDLALVLAAGMREAQVPVAVLLVESGLDSDERHALVAVHVGAQPPPLWPVDPDETLLWPNPPSWFTGEIANDSSGSGAVLVIDPNGLAVDLGTSPAKGLDATFDEAAAAGAGYVRDWTWRCGVVPSTRDGSYHPGDAPKEDPLRPLYLPPTDAKRPLEYLRPEYRSIPFKPSFEVTILEDLAEQALESSTTQVVIVWGAGGAGKTRLALEVADRLKRQGWYAGVLPKGAAGVEWLSRVVTPMLVVVDYAEGRLGTPEAPGDIRRLMSALRQRRPGLATLLILTARQTSGGWLEEYRNELHGQRQLVAERIVPIPTHHLDAKGLYARAVHTLAPTLEKLPDLPPAQDSWTTLDYVLYGWLAAKSDRPLPATKAGLYDDALTHEANYWLTVYADIRRRNADGYDGRDVAAENKPSRPRMLRAAAAITLTQPDPDDVYGILASLPALKHREVELDAIERTLTQCFAADPGLAVRPDPVGDHLVLTELASPAQAKTLQHLTKGKKSWTRALSTLNRAGQEDHDLAVDVIRRLVASRPKRWQAALTLALQQDGPCAEAIEADVTSNDPLLPLAEMSDAIPFTEFLTSRLGAVIDGVRVANARAHEPAENVAPLLERLAERYRLLGDRTGALEAIEEAVTRYRALAQAAPAVYTPNLAGSLNNLSNRRAGTGDPTGALEAIEEAVTLYRALAQAAPAVYTPDLAMSLNNLSNQRADTGDPTSALEAIEEAVTRYRALARAAPAVYTPNLAMSLNNLSGRRAGTGDPTGALEAIEEAVTLYRALAQAAPGVYTPDLAGSLNNLSNRRADTGDPTGALEAIEEAVTRYRALAQAAPAVYTPDLAMSLNNLSNRRAGTGDPTSALEAIEEAVTRYRALAQAAPAVYTPDLAMSLNNLSGRRADTGDPTGALEAIEEAVTRYRALAQAAPAVYTPNLAMSLNNLSNQRAGTGDPTSALEAIEEAVTLYRALAQAAPAVYTPNLAMSLNNLSVQRAGTGDPTGALEAIEEAVTRYRALAQAAPGVYTPNLATSLNNLSNRRADTGDPTSALEAIEEAVTRYRALAQAAPAVYTPDLAMSLNNLSNRRAGTGDPTGALEAIEEAVTLRRALAQAAPAVYTPDLAMSLNNLSNRRADTGDPTSALEAIEEAVTRYRALAQAAPAVYTPNLAGSLNNLSGRRAGTGDPTGALEAIEEAVTLYRALAQAAPAVYTPNLAGSLNNLSVQRADTGDPTGALEAIEEAVTLYRALAQAAPAVYTPNLAMSLNNLSVQRADTGDPTSALEAIEEAVTRYRALAQAAPAVYTPNLAMSLNNLSGRRADTGDPTSALEAIEEAVTLYRALAQAAPAVYTPNLAMSLNNLSKQLAETGADAGEAETRWLDAITAMPQPVARAELQVHYAAHLRGSNPARSRELMADAAPTLDQVDMTDADRSTVLMVPRTRQHLRQLAMSMAADDPASDLEGLPPWATTPIPGSCVGLVNSLGRSDGPHDNLIALEKHQATLQSPDLSHWLDLIDALDPGHPGTALARRLGHEVAHRGSDAVHAELTDITTRIDLLTGWIATDSWPASREYHELHKEHLHHPTTRRLLTHDSSTVAQVHDAILVVAEELGIEAAYEIVTDLDRAEQEASRAIDEGELNRLAGIFWSSPLTRAGDRPTALLTYGVLLLTQDRIDDGLGVVHDLSTALDGNTRHALTVHLKRLARHHPDLQGLVEAIRILDPETEEP